MDALLTATIHLRAFSGEVTDLYADKPDEREVVRIVLGNATVLAERQAAEDLAAALNAYLAAPAKRRVA